MIAMMAIVALIFVCIDLCEGKIDNAFRDLCICLLLWMAA